MTNNYFYNISGHEIFENQQNTVVNDNIICNNFGYDNSTRVLIPVMPPTNPTDDTDRAYFYFITGNQSLAVRFNGNVYYYEKS